MSIGDEIRGFVRRSYEDEHMDPRELLALADRVDRETMPRPRAADGKPVFDGDTLYDGDGNEWAVYGLTATFTVVAKGDGSHRPTPSDGKLTHRRPDSLEAIAGELDEMKERFRTSDSDTFFALQELAGRVHAQAKEREHE